MLTPSRNTVKHLMTVKKSYSRSQKCKCSVQQPSATLHQIKKHVQVTENVKENMQGEAVVRNIQALILTEQSHKTHDACWTHKKHR